MEKRSVMTVCVRGAGMVGKGLADILQTAYGMDICFAEVRKEERTKECTADVYDIQESIEKYRTGTLQKYIISLEYKAEMVEQIAVELFMYRVREDDILFATSRCSGDGVKLLSMEEYRSVQNKMSEWNMESMVTSSDKMKYVICGFGWLEKYIRKLLPAESVIDYNKADVSKQGIDSVFLICDDNIFYYKEVLLQENSRVLYMYEFLQRYYYERPNWFHNYCQMNLTSEIKYIATGISYNNNAVFHPEILNLANSGQDLKHDLAMLKKYYRLCKEEGIHVKGVVMGLYPYCLRYSMEKSKQNRANNLWYIPLELEQYLSIDKFKLEQDWYMWQKEGLDKYLPEFDVKECFYYYYVPAYGKVIFEEDIFTLNQEKTNGIKSDIQKIYSKPYPETIRENKEILKQYFKFAQEEKLSVTVMFPPFTKICKEAWDIHYLNEVMGFLELQSKTFQFQILDLTEMKLPNSYFYDAEHLNRYGSKVVTSVLDEYITQEIVNTQQTDKNVSSGGGVLNKAIFVKLCLMQSFLQYRKIHNKILHKSTSSVM